MANEPKEFVEDLEQQELDSVHATAGRYPDEVANAGLAKVWHSKPFEIYFDELDPETQALLLKAAGINSPEEAGWDRAPIASIVFDKEE